MTDPGRPGGRPGRRVLAPGRRTRHPARQRTRTQYRAAWPPGFSAALQCRTSVPARMCRPGRDTTLADMDISVHPQPSAHPVETGWVDDALASAYAAGDPLGALIGRPLAPGDGIMLVGWPETGPGRYHLIETRPGRSAGPATYLQVVEFSGPRSEEWVAAEQRAAAGRLGPATEGIAGIVSVLRMRAADNAYLVAVLAESMDVFDVAVPGHHVHRPAAGRGSGVPRRSRPDQLLPAGPRRPADPRREPVMTTMTSVGAGMWTADLTRTRAAFAARHLFGQTVHGTIAVTGGTLEVGPDGQPRRFQATLDPASIDTGNPRRDADLRGRRFLAVEAYSRHGGRRRRHRRRRRRVARRRGAAGAPMCGAAAHRRDSWTCSRPRPGCW